MRRLLVAVAFLTRVPVPLGAVGAVDVGRATAAFPLVGALLGLAAAAAAAGLELVLPSALVAVLTVALLAVLTGALHLDALADSADGLGGGRTPEDVLRIMRDHVIGAYGTVALVLTLLAKVTALAALVEAGAATGALVAATAVGRWASVPLGLLLPYARPGGGLGSAVTDGVGPREAVLATLTVAVVAPLSLGPDGLAVWAAAAATALAVGLLARRRIGGVTGDVLGAASELAETLALVAAVALLP